MQKKISILGAGSWGTALAILAARNGCQTTLWGHNPQHIQQLRQHNENQRYLAGFPFPDNLHVTASLEEACQFSNIQLISVPSHAFNETLKKLRPFLLPDTRIAWASKGFSPENGPLLHQVVSNIFAPDMGAAVLSGPTFARETAADLPTAITIASNQQAFAEQLAGIFHNQYFRPYTSHDVIGVQIGGAVKNVLAIAAGIADGLGFGANTRAALIARGLQEMMRLGLALGGQQETFMGLAGLGDLVLTCTDNQSRNRRFGLALGQGENKTQIIQDISQEIEGIAAARETMRLADQHGIEMPISEQTYKVLYQNLPAQFAVRNLLNREQKAELQPPF